MRTTSGERLLKGVTELLTGQSALPAVADFPVIRGHLDLSLGEAWRSEWWGDLMVREQRWFRANWSSASTYGKGDEVYDPYTQKYFQSLRNSNTSHAPTTSSDGGVTYVENSAYWAESKQQYSSTKWVTGTVYAVGDIRLYANNSRTYQCHTAHTASATLVPDATGGDERWGLLTPFERTIDLDATSQTAIGDVMDVKDMDPRVGVQWHSLTWNTLQNKIWVVDAVTNCWVDFRSRRPRLTGAALDDTLAYAAGDQVYWDDDGAIVGNWYDCLATAAAGDTPTSNPELWSVVEIPELFEGFLIWSAYAKTLVGDQQDDRKTMAEANAEMYLGIETDNIYRQQGQTPAMPVRTY